MESIYKKIIGGKLYIGYGLSGNGPYITVLVRELGHPLTQERWRAYVRSPSVSF